MTGPRVLVVDDEVQILRALRTGLRAAGYTVDIADDRGGGARGAALQPPEAMILDLVLPDGRGPTCAGSFAQWTLGADDRAVGGRATSAEKMAALDAGADDYVTKPVGIDELLARLRAVLRRVGPSTEPVLELGQLVIDLEKRTVRVDGRPVRLTPHEFELLRLFAVNEGKLLTHAILREVWGPAYSASRATSTSSSRSSVASSSPIRRGRATS